MILDTEHLILRPWCEGLFMEFVSFVKDEDGNPIYENTYQYAILKREWEQNGK